MPLDTTAEYALKIAVTHFNKEREIVAALWERLTDEREE